MYPLEPLGFMTNSCYVRIHTCYVFLFSRWWTNTFGNIFFKPFSPSLGDFIQDSSILHNTLFTIVFTIHPNLSFFYIPDSSNAGRFPQQEGKSNHVFSVPQMSKSFCKRFFFWYHCHPPLDIIWSSSIQVTKLCLLFIHLRNIFKPSESRCWNHPSLDIET